MCVYIIPFVALSMSVGFSSPKIFPDFIFGEEKRDAYIFSVRCIKGRINLLVRFHDSSNHLGHTVSVRFFLSNFLDLLQRATESFSVS